MTRRLAAILVADLVNYTAQMHADEGATYKRVKADLSDLITPTIAVHHGRIVKTMGDGVLAEFKSVVDCVECARELQTTNLKRQKDLPDNQRFFYRIAVNVGDLIIENDDIYGDGVNLASRLQAIGDPGGIIVSDDAFRQVRGKVDIIFEDLGEREVKGVKERVRVHRALLSSVASAPAAIAPFAGVAPVAVLAFENLSGDPKQRYFSDGITNDIITDLSKFSQLLVLAGHNVAGGSNRSGSVQEVSRMLGVRYLVEGSVRNDAQRVRISVSLFEGDSGRALWGERYDRPIGEIFQLQDEIVQTIVGTLVSRLHQLEHQRILRSRPNNLEAYDAYLRGRAAFAVWTKESNREARRFFREAIKLDPTFAIAYGYLSYSLVQARLGGWEMAPEILGEASALAQKAVELGPSEFDNYWSLAAAHLASRNFDQAMSAYARAGELNPNSPNFLVDKAEALVYIGRVEEAIVNIRRAMRLNPMYPDWYLWTLGIALYHANEYEQSAATLTKGNVPNLARRFLAADYVRLGRIADARRVIAEFLTHEPNYTLVREEVWPYQDQTMRDALVADLRLAGLPDGEERLNGGEVR
ncbi:MAG: hypothetical protein JNJ53_10645 [Rhizobiales bacterium]|nr:hypothetical protein [Hyphomicrobiales bacterium]